MGKTRIALYQRLSREDKDRKGESNSITMQRLLLHKYVSEHFLDYELLEFCDDGYTGTNFNRPGVQKMLEYVRDSKIDCIIVKDFSRFARDYIELGSYLEQIFPFMGVRFISVNDNYDSEEYKGRICDLDINFKNLLYDLYSKDLSQKIKASLSAIKAEGKYVSANAPFGYRKAQSDRHMLLVEEEEAEIVRKIYELTLDGVTSTQIARLLNEQGILTPAEFKLRNGERYRQPKGSRFTWTAPGICRILHNPVYAGDIEYGKTEKDFVGGKVHLKPYEEWKKFYDHHEPIVSREVFDLVQKGRGNKKSNKKDKPHPLTGKAVCGCCGRNLTYRKSRNPYFYCSQRYVNGSAGCVKMVNGMLLEQYVLFELQNKITDSQEQKNQKEEQRAEIEKKLRELAQKERRITAHMAKEKQKALQNYENYVLGRTETYENRKADHRLEFTGLEEEKRIMEERLCEIVDRSDEAGEDSFSAELTREVICRCIDRIAVIDEFEIQIKWK